MQFTDCNPQASYVSKASGRSAAAKYDYVTRGGQFKHHPDRAVASGTIGLPDFAGDTARTYWAAADMHERKNGATMYEYVMPLPIGLPVEEQIALCGDFALHFQRHFKEEAPVITWGLHRGHGKNPHMHFCFGTRLIGARTKRLSPKQFFKRYDGTDRGGAGRFGTNKNNRKFLEIVKDAWRQLANSTAHRLGISTTLVGGKLETQRAEASRLKETATKAKDKHLFASAYWWGIKTLRPVSRHIGLQASKSKSIVAAQARKRHVAAIEARDNFLMSAAATVEAKLIFHDFPVPEECSALAKRWREKYPDLFPELRNDTAIVETHLAPHPVINRPKVGTRNTEAPSIQGGHVGRIGTAHADHEFVKRGNAVDFERKLWRRQYKSEIAPEIASTIAFIDMSFGSFRASSGDFIFDHQRSLKTTRFNKVTVPILVALAKAKGWAHVEIDEPNAFVVEAFQAAGIGIGLPHTVAVETPTLQNPPSLKEAISIARHPKPT